jgi:ADP-ribose pyrophosphatase
MRVDDHEILSSEPVYDGKVVKLFRDRIRLPDGREATWERIVHQGAVGIVPLLENGNILLVRQYRNAPDDVLLEIPAGKLEPGEAPAIATSISISIWPRT